MLVVIGGFTAGFTYDQADEPVAPTNGETWQERSEAGLIVEQWEWLYDQAAWASIARYDLEGALTTGSGYATTNVGLYRPKKRLLVSGQQQIFYVNGTVIDSNNSYLITPIILGPDGEPLYSVNELALTFNAGNSASKTAPINRVLSLGGLRLSRVAKGTPGVVRVQMSFSCRDIR